MKDYSVYNFKLNHDITLTEITVPTCSYRMGVPRMGYGYALIGELAAFQLSRMTSKVLKNFLPLSSSVL